MRSSLYLLFFVLFASMNGAVTDKLIGKWKYSDPSTQETGTMIFDSDSNFTIIDGADTLGGARFYIEDMDIWCRFHYSANYAKTPHEIDIRLIDLGSGEVLNTMYGIFEFKGAALRFCLDEGTERPEVFREDDTLELTRLN